MSESSALPAPISSRGGSLSHLGAGVQKKPAKSSASDSTSSSRGSNSAGTTIASSAMSASQQGHEIKQGEGYSSHHKIPTIASYKEDKARRQEQANKYAAEKENEAPSLPPKDDEPSKKSGQEEKEEMMARMSADKDKPTHFKQKGERRVLDPVTGQDVIVRDADFADGKDKNQYSTDQLAPENPKAKGPSTKPAQGPESVQPLHAAPHPAEPGNILLQQFPPNVEKVNIEAIQIDLNKYAGGLAAALGVLWFFTAFGAGYFRFLLRSSLLIGLGLAGFAASGLLGRKIEKDIEAVRLDMHRQRGEKYSPPTPESTEWLNAILKVAWALVNPDIFVSIADQIEDVMQASLPTFIDAVKVADMGLGTNPLRIISMRGLPDQMGDKTHPREEWITQGDEKENKPQNEDDNSGDYINLEVAFAYQATPKAKGDLRAANFHLMIEFFMGFHDWFHVPFPIWATVEGIVGTVRIRLQMQPGPAPRNLTFTLMGVPKVEVSVQPMFKGLPNVLDLPLISGFVQSAIAAAANEYVAPKSMTLDLASMLSGDGIKKDTNAIGVLVVNIHHAVNLSAQDNNGYSDPYIVCAFAKFGKPLYSTRIVQEDLNPVFEEQAILLVTADEVKAKEDLSIQLWDNDKNSADDLIGRISVPLSKLMKEPNKMFDRKDGLMGFQDNDEMEGELVWSVGYYEKAPFNEKLKTKLGANENLPKEIKEEKKEEELKPSPTPADDKTAVDAMFCPPDPKYPSGVLSIIVHQVNNLERQDLKGASGEKEGEAGQDTDEPSEQSGNLPSGYAEVIINDELVYKSRVKQYTSQPFFEAGTERFIRDWRNTVVRVVIRDSKLREHDAILGIVTLPLSDLFKGSSQVTRLYALQEGVGFGRAKISLLFRGIKIDMPRNLRGWETGTLDILSDIRIESDPAHADTWAGKSLTIGTSDSHTKLPSKMAHSEGNNVIWKIDDEIRLPFYSKFSSACLFEISKSISVGPIAGKANAMAALWLRDFEDDQEVDIRIPVISCNHMKQLRMNYINDQTKSTHEYEILGYLCAKVKLDSGLDLDHEKYAAHSQGARHAFEAYENAEGLAELSEKNAHAMDDGVIDKEEKKSMAHAKKREMASRHRGPHQLAPYRTLIWTKDGIKDRFRALSGHKKPRQPTVESEA